MAVKPIPDGYSALTPYLIVEGASRAIDFYKEAFGAVEVMRMDAPGGKVGHAELTIGGAMLMLADLFPGMLCAAPVAGQTPISLLLYVEDVDAQLPKAVAAGATVTRPLKTQFYGDRSATLTDPFGHVWTLATHVEDVPPAEMQARAAAAMDGPS